jgi:uncharacterized protein (TIGR00290 family)
MTFSTNPPGALVSWSGGKDCNLALYEALQAGTPRIEALFTTEIEGAERMISHGLHMSLVEEQASCLGLSLDRVLMPKGPNNSAYEARTLAHLALHYECGARQVIYGDLFLQDIRDYRDALLKRVDMKGLYPLWGRNTKDLAQNVIGLGFQAVLICVDTTCLDVSFVGRAYDTQLLAELPPEIDPCGENGEFHTFVWQGPSYQRPVRFSRGEIIRDGKYAFLDLIPVN